MTTVPHEEMPSVGALVIFANDRHGDLFRVAKVVGPVVVDPATGWTWLGVQLSEVGDAPDLIAMWSILGASSRG